VLPIASRFLITGFFAFLIAAGSAQAQPTPTLSGVTPVYLKQSESQELTLSGANIGDATLLAMSDARGVTAELIPASGKPTANQLKVKIAAAADAVLGTRELRIITPMGVTAPLVVTVGQYAATRDQEPNNSPEQATTLTFPTSIVGRIDVGGDVDSYRFEAKKGQHLVFDVNAARLGSPLDPVVVVLDASGHEQPRSVSHRGADYIIIFEPVTSGSYTLQVRDVQYRGGGDYAYRIDAGEIPLVESIIPAGGRRGGKIEVRAVGHNLSGHDVQTVDLADAQPGVMPLRFKTSAGFSNDIPFLITDLPPVAEKGSNTSAKSAMSVSLPAEVSGVLANPAEEDFFRFTVPTKQPITLEVSARKTGSPIDALMTLRDANGGVMEQNNGAGEAEPRISKVLEPGDYIVSIRDLTYAGGPSYGYRINMFQAGAPPADFAVRFMPDAARVGRGSNVKLWCEIVRLNGYKGAVAVTLEGLPAGVTVTNGVATINESTSGIFTVTAAPDAPLGSFPIKLKAVGTAGAQQTIRFGEPELNGRFVHDAYLTVIEKTPFIIDALGDVKPEQIAQYQADVPKLFAKLNSSTPELEKAQAEWEKKLGTSPDAWKPLEVTAATSIGETTLKPQPDGSILASNKENKLPETETYTIVAAVSIDKIAGIRLEALPDPSLPSQGPGRNAAGNFVVSRINAVVAPKSDPSQAKPIVLTSASATFEQPKFPASAALEKKPKAGWAIFGGTGKAQTAWFYPDKPIPAGDDVVITISLDQQFGMKHTLGRFRLSVTNDPAAKDKQSETVPPPVAAIVKIAADKRTPEQKASLAAYYRSISPELKAERSKFEALKLTVGPFAEVNRLETLLNQNNAVLDAERKEWEQAIAAGIGWTPVDVTAVKAANGTALVNEKDGSVTAVNGAPATDTYTVTATTPLRTITAIRLEALSDERLPGNGPGRAADGNFVLSKFTIGAIPAPPPAAAETPAAAPEKPKAPAGKPKKADAPAAKPETKVPAVAAVPIALREGSTSFSQANYGLAGAIDERPDTGWAISPLVGRPQTATFFPRQPIVNADGASLSFTLEFAAPKLDGYSLGRFRIWVLGAADATLAANIPPEIQEIIKVPDATRTEPQKAEISAYYRTISPTLEPTRQRLAELKRKLPSLPLNIARNKSGVLPIPIRRSDDFDGPIQLTLEGFSAGRDPKDRQPSPISKNFDITALAADPQTALAKLTIKPKGNCELGTRMVVIRAEGKIGNDTWVEYSPAFPITVVEK
jgi:hypothetical protein